MFDNWSIVLNVLLLVGVLIAIVRTIKQRRDNLRSDYVTPIMNSKDDAPVCDDIIAVRKVNQEDDDFAPTFAKTGKVNDLESDFLEPEFEDVSIYDSKYETDIQDNSSANLSQNDSLSVMMFLLAKDDKQFVGYELLQTLLSAGLRFGEGNLFHRHQFSNGQGPVLCSVAAATSSGMFDMQNIGAFSVHGLCIFMTASKNPGIDKERFAIMLDTAKQLSEDLDAYLLDENKQPLTGLTLKRYCRLLNIDESSEMELA